MRIVVRSLALSGLLSALVIATPESGWAIPGSEELALADGPERVSILLSLGLDAEAQRLLEVEIQKGETWARGSLVSLLLRRGRTAEALERLEAWGGVEAIGEELSLFAYGRVLEGEERWEEAAEVYSGSVEREPFLADHAAYRAGLAYAEAGRIEEALQLLETAGASAKTTDLAATAHWEAAKLAVGAGLPDRALVDLERTPVRSTVSKRDRYELEARVHRLRDDPVHEAHVLRELFEVAPSSEQAVAAIDRLVELVDPTPLDRVLFAEAALGNRHPTLAEKQARLALAGLAGTDDPVLEGRARLALGKALMGRRRLTAARAELADMPAKADVEDRAEALLDRARCLWRLKQIDACLAEYDRVADGNFPEEFRATASWEAGREAKDNARWQEAAVRLGEFQRDYPDHEYADRALWHRGRVLAEQGQTAEAIESFELVRRRYPDSRYLEESEYWVANLQRADGREDEACATFEILLTEHADSYWAERSREVLADEPCPEGAVLPELLERDPSDWLSEVLPDLSTEAAQEISDRIGESDSFRRAAALASVGLVHDAENELKGLRQTLGRDTAALVALAEASWRIGVPRAGMRAISVVKARVGQPILSGATPPSVARLLYPMEHLDIVLKWSAEYDLDPLFVYAVMREESWFDVEAVSWVGALGLLQIMPSTGRDLARQVGLTGFDRTDLHDPEVNIHLGTYYLRALLNQFDLEPALALSAYNAGSHNALRWKNKLDGEFDVDRYVAGITYRETYNYVQKVSRSWAIYRHLYAELVPQLEGLHNGQ